jgi:hypothetical protein
LHGRGQGFESPRLHPRITCLSVHAGGLVTIAEGVHPFPSRTRKLSLPALTILQGQPCGKIGRRRPTCLYGHQAFPLIPISTSECLILTNPFPMSITYAIMQARRHSLQRKKVTIQIPFSDLLTTIGRWQGWWSVGLPPNPHSTLTKLASHRRWRGDLNSYEKK